MFYRCAGPPHTKSLNVRAMTHRAVAVAFFSVSVCLSEELAAQTSPQGWELVRSVPNANVGPMDLVVVPLEKQTDLKYFERVARDVCGSRTSCMVFFWTDRSKVADSAWFQGPSMQALTAQYERHPSYKQPVLRLACWLYPSQAVGESKQCFYMPGAKVPPN